MKRLVDAAAATSGDESPVVLTNWAFERVGTLIVLCSVGEHPPPDQDFEIWMRRMLQTDFDRLLIYSEGGSPSAKQRTRISEGWKATGRVAHVALMTDSKIARGFLTAIGWFIGGTMKPIPLTELNAALAWLKAEDSSRQVAEAIARLRSLLRRNAARSA